MFTGVSLFIVIEWSSWYRMPALLLSCFDFSLLAAAAQNSLHCCLNESVSCWKKYKRPTCRHLVEALDTAFQSSPCMTLVCPHEASWVWSNICMIPEINTAHVYGWYILILILKMAHVVQSGFGRLSWFAKSVCRPGVTNLGLGAILGFLFSPKKINPKKLGEVKSTAFIN